MRTSTHSSLSTGRNSISSVDVWERLCSAQAFSIPLYYCLYSELYLRHINHCNFPTVTFSFSSYVSSHTGPPTKHSSPLSPYWFLGLTSVHLAQRANSLGKDSDAWKYWRQEEEEVTADATPSSFSKTQQKAEGELQQPFSNPDGDQPRTEMSGMHRVHLPIHALWSFWNWVPSSEEKGRAHLWKTEHWSQTYK